MATHSRNNSVSSTFNLPRTYSSVERSRNQNYSRPESLRDTAYNGSEGFIGDSTPSVFGDRDNRADSQLARPSPIATPTRPALGARLLSSFSNAQPAAAALSRKGSVLHSRAKSLAAFVPKLNTSNTSLASTPERNERPQAPHKIFGDLFNGESAPIRLGAPVSPTKEKEESEFVMEYKPTLTERPDGMRRRGTVESAASTIQLPKATSWFKRKPTFSSTSRASQDELAALDINASLFPNGPTDPLNPASFNDLLLNATSLLQRMQTAYKEKVDCIASVQPEIDAQREEVEEAETRSKHLKMQLEDMSRQVQESEKATQEMARQLAEEKMKVQEAQESSKTVRLVRRSIDASRDEDTPTRRRKRGSIETASDSGFESDMESVFSSTTSDGERPQSPPTSVSTAGFDGRTWNLRQPKAREEAPYDPVKRNVGKRVGSAGAAWATVDSLRNENRDLKIQMKEMQRNLQGCIDLVAGVVNV